MNIDLFVQNVKHLCAERGISPTAACKESGVGTSFIPDIKRGRIPSIDKFEKLAIYLGVTVSDLIGDMDRADIVLRENLVRAARKRLAAEGVSFGGEAAASPGAIRIPVLGTIPAGIPLEAVEDIQDWEEVPAAWADGGREYFGLQVKGDSMYPQYLGGDTVILRKATTCDSGDDCAVLVNGDEATLKRVFLHEDGAIELRPVNAAYPPRTYSPAEVESLPVQIIGVVVELRRKIK